MVAEDMDMSGKWKWRKVTRIYCGSPSRRGCQTFL